MLAERLMRMKVTTLANYLDDKDAEIRRAVALTSRQRRQNGDRQPDPAVVRSGAASRGSRAFRP